MGFLRKLFGTEPKPGGERKDATSEKIAYVGWVCCSDEDSCNECKALDGLSWIPGLANPPELPLKVCKSREGCRCQIVGVFSNEGCVVSVDSSGEERISAGERSAPLVAEYIRSLGGGPATSSQITAYFDAKEAPLRAMRAKENVASRKRNAAYLCEKNDPEESIRLYRESIAISSEIQANPPDSFTWNRLTLVLERLGKYREALGAIAEFESLPDRSRSNQFYTQAIEKRKVRLQRRVR